MNFLLLCNIIFDIVEELPVFQEITIFRDKSFPWHNYSHKSYIEDTGTLKTYVPCIK